jgi:ABC-2 type transport system permease protein
MTDRSAREPLDRSTWGAVTRHARLWRACFTLALVRETQFRVNFLSTIVIGLVQIAIGLIPILLLYSYTSEVRGWSQADVIVLLGLHGVMSGLIGMFVIRNMWAMTDYVTKGELDLLLIRPVNAQFHVATRWIRPDQSFNVIAGLVVAGVGLARGDASPDAVDFVQALVVFLAGFVLITCAWSALSYLAFWTHAIGTVIMFFQDVMQAGRYPVGFFPVVVRAILTALVPLAFATTFPAQAMTDGISWWLVAGSVLFAAAAVTLLRFFWTHAVRRYSSASS